MNTNKKMKIAIHPRKDSFSDKWIEYCRSNSLSFKIVNCYKSDIIKQLNDCYALMWHFSHANYLDYQVAKSLMTAVENSGKKVFPNISSFWHFNDKVAQKYLLEAMQAPMVKSYVFYSKEDALSWIRTASFPKVFKLKCGAGSSNVKMVKNKKQAINLVKKSFKEGFRQSDRITLFKYSIKKYQLQKNDFKSVILSFLKIFKLSKFEKHKGNEVGYAYFQDFIPNNDSDIRIIIIGDKAFGIKRMVRKNDFRASGSGNIIYDKNQINRKCINIAFELNKKFGANCLAYDFIFDQNENPLIVEISFGFTPKAYENCPGYWDSFLIWHEGKFCPQDWMVENIINS